MDFDVLSATSYSSLWNGVDRIMSSEELEKTLDSFRSPVEPTWESAVSSKKRTEHQNVDSEGAVFFRITSVEKKALAKGLWPKSLRERTLEVVHSGLKRSCLIDRVSALMAEYGILIKNRYDRDALSHFLGNIRKREDFCENFAAGKKRIQIGELLETISESSRAESPSEGIGQRVTKVSLFEKKNLEKGLWPKSLRERTLQALDSGLGGSRLLDAVLALVEEYGVLVEKQKNRSYLSRILGRIRKSEDYRQKFADGLKRFRILDRK